MSQSPEYKDPFYSDKPMFFFAGVYADHDAAEADYEAIKALHAAGDIGSYDAATIVKDAAGKVHVAKTEKPTQHGGWIGLAAGAAAAVIFPVLLPAVVVGGAAGAGLGAWFGHLAHGTSRADAKEIGALLNRGSAALIVIGVDHDAAKIELAAAKAKEHVLRRLPHSHWEEAEREAIEAMHKSDDSY
jgi:uncharacterized membrane protein